jgi:hypothetical protein
MYDYLREGIGYRQGEKENKIKKGKLHILDTSVGL